MRFPGSLVAVGRTSDVFEYGPDSVVKVLRPGIPSQWAELEADLTAAVHARGLPTPAVRDLLTVDGRTGIVFERVDGPSMWTEMLRSTTAAAQLAASLASLHRQLQAEEAPEALPSLRERVAAKVRDANLLTAVEREGVQALVNGLGEGSALCHGDLHPGNVLMSERGPIVIDWYDACSGPPLADIVRTSLLIRPPADDDGLPPHLPGATTALLAEIHQRYLAAVLAGGTVSGPSVRGWESVLAASRLAERAEPDEAQLLALWRARGAADSSPLLRALDSLDLLEESSD